MARPPVRRLRPAMPNAEGEGQGDFWSELMEAREGAVPGSICVNVDTGTS